jgi:hypothetical protein
VTPKLFIVSMNAVFPYLSERHLDIDPISNVGDMGPTLRRIDLDEEVEELESIAGHAVE